MILFDGKKEASKVLKKIKLELKKNKYKPTLAVILVGEDRASKLYVSLKKKTAEDLGISFKLFKLKKSVNDNELLSLIKTLNKDKNIDGILVQLPLPKHLHADKITSAIDPKKDVDGFHSDNLKIMQKSNIFPVLPAVLFYIAKKSKLNLKKSKNKAIVNSDKFASVLKDFFALNSVNIEVLNVKGKRKEIISNFVSDADMLISVISRPNIISYKMIKKDVVLIDAGIIKKGKKIFGNIDKKAYKKAKFVSPVPGGVGPMTIAFLFLNLLSLKRKK